MSENSEKLKALQLTIDKLEKAYGKGTVMKLSDEKVQDIPAISTGSIGLDIALGIGGIPRGRVIEVYGPESSGKTTLALHCISEAQKSGASSTSLPSILALIAPSSSSLNSGLSSSRPLTVSRP